MGDSVDTNGWIDIGLSDDATEWIAASITLGLLFGPILGILAGLGTESIAIAILVTVGTPLCFAFGATWFMLSLVAGDVIVNRVFGQ